ncbi:MAG: nucleoside-diphosphate sugar epimerase [Ectothiorhodospiraceae bacterium]|nr:nucleoside-diphosphate sugar epimerase [Ectothiorhodospiraceae bacterium]
MAEKKRIAVLGATGAQGGGLANAILNDPNSEFTLRAITRDPSKDSAKALAERGAEVVQGDLDNLDSLKAAFAGCYGVFGLTNYWEFMDPERERTQANNIAEAAKDAGVSHVIWSTFEDTRRWVPLANDSMPTLMEKYKVPHFDAKAEADAHFKELGVPTTFLYTSFYWDNFIYFGMGPKKSEDGKYAITLPMGDKKLPGISADDIGKAAYGIFKEGDKYIGETVGVAGEHLTGTEMAQKLGNALNLEVGYNAVPADVFRSFGFPGADDMGNMFQFKAEFNGDYTGARPVDRTNELTGGKLKSLDDWLAENAKRIPLE